MQNRAGNRREFKASGGVSLISSRATLEGPLSTGSWMLAGRRTYIDPVLKAVRGASDELDELGYFFYDINGKVNSQLSDNDNLVISFYGGGDELSLGFVAETERQVEAHLEDHLSRLPQADTKSKAILERMAEDEAHHGTTARLAGGVDLPLPVRSIMTLGGEILRRFALRV